MFHVELSRRKIPLVPKATTRVKHTIYCGVKDTAHKFTGPKAKNFVRSVLDIMDSLALECMNGVFFESKGIPLNLKWS